MSRFGPDPHAFFDTVYTDTPPWDVGGPQPGMLALFDQYPPHGPVLDVGCGSGDLSISLAQRGIETLGVDFVETAISEARRKAAALPRDVAARLKFSVADATRPSRLGLQCGSIVDSGFLHLFDPDQIDDFVDELARALQPRGRYYLLAFAVTFPIPNSPRAILEDELRSRFSPKKGWHMLSCQPAEFMSRVATVPATAACIERSGPRP